MNKQLIASSGSRARRLTEAEIAEIEHEKKHYPQRRAVGLEALKIVQRHQGWVSDQSLQAVAAYLDLPVAELEGVATFFNLVYRQPVGRRVILFCNSVSCWIRGCETVRSHLRDRLGVDFGQTTADREFTFLPVPCLGDCDHAPVMMVGEDLHGNLDRDRVDAVLARYRATGDGGSAGGAPVGTVALSDPTEATSPTESDS